MKKIRVVLVTLLVVFMALFSFAKDRVINSLHNASHELGLCQGDEVGARFAGMDQNSAAACASNPACAPSNAAVMLTDYSQDERKVIDYVCDLVASAKSGEQLAINSEDIEEGTGVSLANMKLERLQAGVLAELNRRNFNFAGLAGGGYCSKFSACSVDRDLSGATGEELVRYKKEKTQDGMVFTDWYVPDFTLPTTDGKKVRLSDYRGRPVAVVFLSGHCSHSFDTLPILAELKEKYDHEDLAILPVYVNSGSVDDILTWSSEMDLGYPLLVANTKELSNEYDSRMVPSTFFIDREGRVTKKFVGYKDKVLLDEAFSELVEL